MLNNSFNAPDVSMVQLVLRKMPKDTFNLLKQQNQTKNFQNTKNDNSLYNANNQLVSNSGAFAKNVKMSLSKSNSGHQRNHSFSDIFIR